jgi:hypothetical protein
VEGLMSPTVVFWHVLNGLMPAFLTAALAAGLCKLLWRQELRDVSWLRMWGWGSAAGVVALVGGLLAFGRDGRMATYAMLILFNAAAMAWAGWGHKAPRRPSAVSRRP